MSAPSVATVRLLQVLGDTDDTDDARFALDLHARLADLGLEVRTLALGPGRRGGLESLVPVMSPSRRSLAAHTQLRREQRWADVVVLREGPAALVAGLARRGGPPTVLALAEDAVRWSNQPVPSRVRRVVEQATAVVVTDDPSRSVAGALGRDPGELTVIPYGVDVRPPPVSDRARVAARALLGLPADGAVARFVGTAGECDDLGGARDAARRAGVPLVDDGAGEPEVVAAAADVAVLVTSRRSGPPRGVLLAGRDGSALVAPGRGGLAHLVDGRTGVPAEGTGGVADALAALAGDDALRRDRGAAAAARVRSEYDLAPVAERWAALVRACAGR